MEAMNGKASPFDRGYDCGFLLMSFSSVQGIPESPYPIGSDEDRQWNCGVLKYVYENSEFVRSDPECLKFLNLIDPYPAFPMEDPFTDGVCDSHWLLTYSSVRRIPQCKYPPASEGERQWRLGILKGIGGRSEFIRKNKETKDFLDSIRP